MKPPPKITGLLLVAVMPLLVPAWADSPSPASGDTASPGQVTTLAGSVGVKGSSDGTGSAARFSAPQAVVVDGNGNVYVADTGNDTIRKITPDGQVTTLAGSPGQRGGSDGSGSAARFAAPSGIAVDGRGNVYVGDTDSHTIRKITPDGVVTTLAGSADQRGSNDGTGSAARFNSPLGVAVDGSGNVYVADMRNNTIRKVTPDGVVTTLAGRAGQAGSIDGTGSDARFDAPRGVAVDRNGNLYVACYESNNIRKITPDGVVTTLAGIPGELGSKDGTGSAARFHTPVGMAVDDNGNVYVGDLANHAIRRITPDGVVTTLAGSPGHSGSSDGRGISAQFHFPCGITVDGSGNLYVADRGNSTIRKITPGAAETTPRSAAMTASQSGPGTTPLLALITPPQPDYLINTDLQEGLSGWHGDGETVFLKPDGTEGGQTDPGAVRVFKLRLSSTPRSIYQEFRTSDYPATLHVKVDIYPSADYQRSHSPGDYTPELLGSARGNFEWPAFGVPQADFWIKAGPASTRGGFEYWYFVTAYARQGQWLTVEHTFDDVERIDDRSVYFCVPPGVGTLYLRNPSVKP